VQSTKPQVAFQSTPSFDGSPVTDAAKATPDPEGAEAGGSCVMVTPVTREITVTELARALLWSVAESAVTDTELPLGTARGAVNIELAPLAVCEGEKEPQFGALPHTATQSTPAFARSLLTVAETGAVEPTVKEAGGAWLTDKEIRGVSEEFVFVALAEQPAKAKEAARTNKDARQVRWRGCPAICTFVPR